MEQFPQNPQQSYGQNMQSSYSPLPQDQYAQSPQTPYPQNSQNVQPSYPQNPQQPYGQNMQAPHPQNPQHPAFQGQSRQQYKHNFTEKQMRRYFYKPPTLFIWLTFIGGAFFLLGIMIGISASSAGAFGGIAGLLLGGPLIFWGIVIGCIGGIPLLIHYSGRPTPEQYAEWVLERSLPLYTTAFQRLHLDESQCKSIVEVQGGISSILQLTKKFPEKEVVLKRLPNGLRHYSINTSMYIFLTEDAIAIYSGYINALSQQERFEDAVRYYYKDIVAVTTSGPVFIISDGLSEKEIQMQGFLVRANNGDVVGTDYATRVLLRDGEKKERLRGVDEVVPALLHFLNDHKSSPGNIL